MPDMQFGAFGLDDDAKIGVSRLVCQKPLRVNPLASFNDWANGVHAQKAKVLSE